ncbi:MAG: 50S ribosomal protein L21, partial [Sphaerochaetaceae bacterium]
SMKPSLIKDSDMYALVEILGKQYKAIEGETLRVDHIDLKKAGDSLEYASVLAIVDENNAKFGTPYVEGAKVQASYLGDKLGDKVRVFKYERRKGYRRTQGHREQYSLIKIDHVIA